MHIDQLRARFLEPLADDRMMPFWFWNDHLEPDELVRQVDSLAAAGCGGFLIHPRLGLSREVGYLTERWFELVGLACREARRRGLKILLYDEGMYPSGAAHGRVTRGHPEYCARGLAHLRERFDGPGIRYWRVAAGEILGDQIVAALLTPLDGETPRYAETRRLTPDLRGLVRLELGAGRWQVDGFLDVLTGGRIRGVHLGEDDNEADAPPAADLLNPAATARFIATTHEAYRAAVGEHFGETIVGIFVDEPSLSGRGPQRRGLRPWTGGFEAVLGAHGVESAELPALFDDAHPAAEAVRATFDRLVAERLNETFYGPIAAWCEANGLALVGHPADSDDMHSLRTFTWPGQDIVWRYIVPGEPSTMEGVHSTAARAATSAKRVWGKARAATECGGAFGWQMTFEELKGVIDWHLARGNDLIIPHAFYYSLRGNRAYERPPDLGPGATWWPYFRTLGDYVGSLCALLRLGLPRAETAIACDPRHVPAGVAKILHERQIDFDYVPRDDAAALSRYAEVIADPPGPLPDGIVATAPEAASRRALWLEPEQPTVRAMRLDLGALAVWLVFCEGNDSVEATATLPAVGGLQVWDPWRRTTAPVGAEPVDGGLRLRLALERRQALVLVVDPSAPASPPEPPAEWSPVDAELTWQWRPPGEAWSDCRLVDWTGRRELERFAGVIRYRTRVVAPAEGVYRLDLGEVGEWAAAWRGEPGRPGDANLLGVRAGAPYRFELGRLAAGEGVTLTVEIGNSRANELLGAMRPSGLFGPVRLERR